MFLEQIGKCLNVLLLLGDGRGLHVHEGGPQAEGVAELGLRRQFRERFAVLCDFWTLALLPKQVAPPFGPSVLEPNLERKLVVYFIGETV